MRMVRKPLNLLVDEDLIIKARNHGLVLSKFFENKLREYLAFNESVSKVQNVQNESECGCRDLNPSYKLGKLK
jgi:hypothetical protein